MCYVMCERFRVMDGGREEILVHRNPYTRLAEYHPNRKAGAFGAKNRFRCSQKIGVNVGLRFFMSCVSVGCHVYPKLPYFVM